MDEFKLEEHKLFQYEVASNKEITEDESKIAYRELNSRFWELEKQNIGQKAMDQRHADHARKKKAIETEWHNKTSLRVNAITQNARGSKSSKAYYNNFDLKQMEVLIKNSDRGGNSKEYNDVATDLELYNRMSEKTDENELMTLLIRLQESAQKYVSERSGWRGSSKGRIRKAMISSLLDKVNLKVNTNREEFKSKANASYEAMAGEKTVESVDKACLDNFNLIANIVRGNMTMSKEEIAVIDTHMQEILSNLKEQPISDNQNPVYTTRFMNALGWSSHKPKVVEGKIDEYTEDFKNSPLKIRMYHAINAVNGKAIKMGKQLLGIGADSKHYLSDGMFGKGTYLAANGAKADPTDSSDTKTRYHGISKYGENIGSLQFTMIHNENARIISTADLEKLEEKLKRQFPKMYEEIRRNEVNGQRGNGDSRLSMYAAFFGYNTINAGQGCSDGTVDYYVTFDRKALTISADAVIRTKDNQYESRDEMLDAKILDVRLYDDDFDVTKPGENAIF